MTHGSGYHTAKGCCARCACPVMMVPLLPPHGETASEARPGWATPYLSDSNHVCQTVMTCAQS